MLHTIKNLIKTPWLSMYWEAFNKKVATDATKPDPNSTLTYLKMCHRGSFPCGTCFFSDDDDDDDDNVRPSKSW